MVTRDSLLAGSRNLVQLWLVGEHGEADLGKKLGPVRSEVGAQPAGHWGSGGGGRAVGGSRGGGRAVGGSAERGWAVGGGGTRRGGRAGVRSPVPCSPMRSVRVGSEGRWAVSPAARPASRRQDLQAGVRARSRSCRRREFEVSVPVHLGRLLLAKLRKILLDDAWFCERISARPGDPGRAPLPLLPPGAGRPGRLPALGHRWGCGGRRAGLEEAGVGVGSP